MISVSILYVLFVWETGWILLSICVDLLTLFMVTSEDYKWQCVLREKERKMQIYCPSIRAKVRWSEFLSQTYDTMISFRLDKSLY